MNLLVTNTRNAQAYATIRPCGPTPTRSFRLWKVTIRLPLGSPIRGALAWLIDVTLLHSPAADWRTRKIQRENTKNEETYIQAVLKICEKDKTDTIFPSFDPHVYVFSKNKERFERLGIIIFIPDYETVLIPLDKYRTIQREFQSLKIFGF